MHIIPIRLSDPALQRTPHAFPTQLSPHEIIPLPAAIVGEPWTLCLHCPHLRLVEVFCHSCSAVDELPLFESMLRPLRGRGILLGSVGGTQAHVWEPYRLHRAGAASPRSGLLKDMPRDMLRGPPSLPSSLHFFLSAGLVAAAVSDMFVAGPQDGRTVPTFDRSFLGIECPHSQIHAPQGQGGDPGSAGHVSISPHSSGILVLQVMAHVVH